MAITPLIAAARLPVARAGRAPLAPLETVPLSTRGTVERPFDEVGLLFGQALGEAEGVDRALINLQYIAYQHGCDAVLAVELAGYPTTSGAVVVAYGTGIRFRA